MYSSGLTEMGGGQKKSSTPTAASASPSSSSSPSSAASPTNASNAVSGSDVVMTINKPHTTGVATSSSTTTAFSAHTTGGLTVAVEGGPDITGTMSSSSSSSSVVVRTSTPASPRGLKIELSAANAAAAAGAAAAGAADIGSYHHPHLHHHQHHQCQHHRPVGSTLWVNTTVDMPVPSLDVLRGDHHYHHHQQQQQQQHHFPPNPQYTFATMEKAGTTIQRWFRRLCQGWTLARQVLEVVPMHLLPLLQAAEGLGAGPWGNEWEALCQKERGLARHARGVVMGLDLGISFISSLPAMKAAAEELITHPETVLSALLVDKYPESVTNISSTPCAGASNEGRYQYERKGAALARGAVRVRETLVALYLVLQKASKNAVPTRRVLRAIKRTKHALVMFVIKREQCRGVAVAETQTLADSLTAAYADVLEAVATTERDMFLMLHQTRQYHQLQQQVQGQHQQSEQEMEMHRALASCKDVIRVAVTKLGEIEQGLEKTLGQPEAMRRIDHARRVAKERVEKSTTAAAVAAPSPSPSPSLSASQDAAVSTTTAINTTTPPPPADEKPLKKQKRQHNHHEQQHQPQKYSSSRTRTQTQTHQPTSYPQDSPESLYSNEWLVHEICVLPQGRFLQVSLEDTTDTHTHTQTNGNNTSGSSSSAEVYWASVTRTLLAGDYTPLLVLVQELGERLISITPSRSDLAEEVTAALDVSLLEQVLSKDVLDSKLLFSMLRFAGERVLWLEAPARNASTEAWLARLNELEAQVMAQACGVPVRLSMKGGRKEKEKENGAAGGGEWVPLVSPLFEFLLEKVDQVHVDIFNSHVRRATPHCRAHGPAFERQRFEERVEKGETSLIRVREWITTVLKSEWCAAQTLPVKDYRYGVHAISIMEGLRQNREDALRVLVRRAYSVLLGEGAAVSPQALGGYDAEESVLVIPETLAMDAHRLDVVRHALLCVARAATLVAYLGQALGRSLSGEERQEALQGLMVLLPEEAVLGEDICLHIGQLAVKLGLADVSAKTLLETRVGRMLKEGSCPVLRLLYQRSVEAVHAVLRRDGAPLAEEEAREMEQERRRLGLAGLEGWIVKVTDLLLLICRHNEAAFLPVYQKVALEVVGVGAQEEGKAGEEEESSNVAMMVGEE